MSLVAPSGNPLQFVYEGRRHSVASGSHVIHVFSFSKAYGMMGWRVGYIAYPDADGSDALGAQILKVRPTVCCWVAWSARRRGGRGSCGWTLAVGAGAACDRRHMRLTSLLVGGKSFHLRPPAGAVWSAAALKLATAHCPRLATPPAGARHHPHLPHTAESARGPGCLGARRRLRGREHPGPGG